MFTGRSAIWQVLLEAISGNYILGLGYGAVWSAGEYSAITNFGLNTSSWVSSISHGHNGYLDIWLSTGIVGLLLFTFLLFKALFNNINKLRWIGILPPVELRIANIERVFCP